MTEVIAIYEVRRNQFVVEYLCDYCSSESESRKSHYDKKQRHFCSQRCYSSYRTEIMRPEEHNKYGTGNTPEERAKRRKARSDLNHAIAQGRISRSLCTVEGCLDWAEAHHEDYDKPLDIMWLCFVHHREWHKLKAEAIYENPEPVQQ